MSRFNRLTQEKFFQIANWMQNNKEMLLRERYNSTSLVKLLHEALAIHVSEASLPSLKKAAGIEYKPKSPQQKGTGGKRIEYLARVLAELLTELGKDVPDKLHRMCRHQSFQDTPPPAPPIPASVVVDPKTMSIVK